VLNGEDIRQFVKVYVPHAKTIEALQDAAISPMYAKLDNDLAPSLFQCGTHDCLLDDTLFMSARYTAAGNKAAVKIYPGAPHVCHSSDATS
jgi:acetyl esterase/lipase